MHDATLIIAEADQVQPELLAIDFHLPNLVRGLFTDYGKILEAGDRRCRRRMIHRGQGKVGPAYRNAVFAQYAESLWRRNLMDNVQIDVQDRWCVGCLGHDYVF